MRRLLVSIILCIGVSLAAAEFDPALQGVRFFAYQLQNFDTPEGLQALAYSHYDLLVIDQTRSIKGSEDYDSAADVASLHATLGSSVNPKKVVCYLDAGQAEDFRWYWQDGWGMGNPAWILAPDPDWPGDYPVKFWDPAWKALMKQDLAIIVADGYDGAYLDWMEIYAFGPLVQAAQAEGRDPREEMIAFIRELRDYARSLNPNFFLIAQNAAELGACREWLDLFSGIGQEDVWFTWGDGGPGDVPQDPELTATILSDLALWKAAGKVVFTIEYAQEPANVATAYSNGKAEGFITYMTTKELDQLAPTPPPDYKVYDLTPTAYFVAHDPVFSPDGESLVYSWLGSIFEIKVDGTGSRRVWDWAEYSSTKSGWSWSAISNRIYFTCDLTGEDQIWSITPDGTEEKLETEGVLKAGDPTISPDGHWLAFTSTNSGAGDDWHIFKKNLDSGEIVQLTSGTCNDFEPDWSPANNLIAFRSDRSGSNQIWIMDIQGGNLRNISSASVNDESPVFSPDGKWIIYASPSTSYRKDAFIVSVADPSQRFKLTGGKTSQGIDGLSISPDGKLLAFSEWGYDYTHIMTMPIYLPPPSEHERPLARP